MAVFDFLRDSQKKSAEKLKKAGQQMKIESAIKEDPFDPFVPAPIANQKRRIEEIQIDLIVPNPSQPRVTFDDDTIGELAQSIKNVGLIQPILVREKGDGAYELVAGERRLRACKMNDMEKITCIVQNDVYEEDSALMALIENLQRENLHYLEEAQCYQSLINAYNLKQDELAERLGKSQSFIANKLRVLKLSPAVKDAMKDAGLTERHARALLKLTDEAMQLETVEKVKESGLSVKDTESLVDKTLNKAYDQKKEGAKPRPMILRVIKDYRLFMNTINIAVNQLKAADMDVSVEQTDRDDGVDIQIHITRIQR